MTATILQFPPYVGAFSKGDPVPPGLFNPEGLRDVLVTFGTDCRISREAESVRINKLGEGPFFDIRSATGDRVDCEITALINIDCRDRGQPMLWFRK